MQSLYGDYPRIITKNRKKRRKSALPVATALIFLLSLGALIIAFLPSKETSKITIGARSWYFVIVDEHTEIVKAEVEAALTREKGGAGYILNDGAYKVAAAVYASFSDAEKIVERIDNATVKKVKIERFSVNGIAKADAQNLKKSFNFYETLYKNILASVEKFEREEISESKLLYEIAEWHNETKRKVEEMKSLSSKYPIPTVTAFLTFAQNLEKIVNSAIMDEEHTAAVRTRYALCKIVFERYLLSAIIGE
jgi:hypothetical protein